MSRLESAWLTALELLGNLTALSPVIIGSRRRVEDREYNAFVLGRDAERLIAGLGPRRGPEPPRKRHLHAV